MSLTRNEPRVFLGDHLPIEAHPIATNTHLYAGSAVMGSTNGYVQTAAAGAVAPFLGFLMEEINNLTGSDLGGAAGAVDCPIAVQGLVEIPVAHTTTWALTDRGVTVYATADDTFTLAAGTNNMVLGKVARVPAAAVGAASATVLVFFQAAHRRSI